MPIKRRGASKKLIALKGGRSVAVGQKAKQLRRSMGMTRPVFARLVDISERSLADLESQKRAPTSSVQRRVAEVDRLQAALAQVIDAEAIGQWLQTPNPAFGDLKPLELIERGQTDRLWRMIHEIESGQPF